MKKHILNRIYATETGRWALSAAISLFIIAAVFVLVHPFFMTIDDARLMYVYAGYATGTPESLYLFQKFPVSGLISFLYRTVPSVPWYILLHFTAIFFSYTVIGHAVYKNCWLKKRPLWFAAAVHLVLYLTLCLITNTLLHFEITGALIGTSGLLFLLDLSFDGQSRRSNIIKAFIALILLLISFSVSREAFYAVFCYSLVVGVYYLFRTLPDRKAFFRMACRIAVYAVILAGVIYAVTTADESLRGEDWKKYNEYNKYRVSFWDYPHITYDEDPELFESINWDKSFYDITQRMYFMDERFSRENLEQFVERFSWFHLGDNERPVEAWKNSMVSLYRNDNYAFVQLAVLLLELILLIWLAAGPSKKKAYPALAALILSLAGTAVLISFLALRGRLPLRAWMTCIIPCGMIGAVIVLQTMEEGRARNRRSVFSAAVILALIALFARPVAADIRQDRAYRNTSSDYLIQIESYALDHPDDVFVIDLFGAQNYRCFSLYPDQKPSNVIVWGSSYIYTPTYYNQLEAMGKEQLFTENFFDEDVKYITSRELGDVEPLRDMLNSRYPHTYLIAVDRTEGLTVYRVKRF